MRLDVPDASLHIFMQNIDHSNEATEAPVWYCASRFQGIFPHTQSNALVKSMKSRQFYS